LNLVGEEEWMLCKKVRPVNNHRPRALTKTHRFLEGTWSLILSEKDEDDPDLKKKI